MTPEKMEETLVSICCSLEAIKQRMEEIDSALKRDYHIFHGNGKPGILDRLQALETWRESQKSSMAALGRVVAFLASMAALGISLLSVLHH